MQNTMGGAKIKMKIFVETEKGKMNRGENSGLEKEEEKIHF